LKDCLFIKAANGDEIYSSSEGDLSAAVRTRTKIILKASGDISGNGGLILIGRAVKMTTSIKIPNLKLRHMPLKYFPVAQPPRGGNRLTVSLDYESAGRALTSDKKRAPKAYDPVRIASKTGRTFIHVAAADTEATSS
jgi:hypothetical protein